MQWQIPVLMAIASVIGGALAWVVARLRGAALLGARDAELAGLRERLSGRDAQLTQAEARIAAVTDERDRARDDAAAVERARHAAEIARSAAEASLRTLAERVQALEQALVERERAALCAADEAAAARARVAEAETRLADERKAANDKLALVEDAQRRLEQAFKALSSDALKSNNQAFMELAQSTLARFQDSAKGDLELRNQKIEALVKPLAETVSKLDGRLGELDQARATASGQLEQQIRQLTENQGTLQRETRNLVEALRRPHTRGRWGETQLRRVVEMAGMVEHCDFCEQVVADGDSRLRPDLVVKLPGGKSVVVDAKAAMSAYLEALEATDDERRHDRLKAHARHLRDHIDQLSAKAYWEQFQPAPEFVVLFVPGDGLLSAAFEHDATLIEHAMAQRVVIATPTTLIAVLRAVAYGWRQEQLQRNAAAISDLGRELHKRISELTGHFVKLRGHLSNAVDSYNGAIGSLERRVLPQARKFKELGAGDARAEVPLLDPVEASPRGLSAPELQGEAKPAA